MAKSFNKESLFSSVEVMINKHANSFNRCLLVTAFRSFAENLLYLHLARPCIYMCTFDAACSSKSPPLGRRPSLSRLSTADYCQANLRQYLSSSLVHGGLDNLDCSSGVGTFRIASRGSLKDCQNSGSGPKRVTLNIKSTI